MEKSLSLSNILFCFKYFVSVSEFTLTAVKWSLNEMSYTGF